LNEIERQFSHSHPALAGCLDEVFPSNRFNGLSLDPVEKPLKRLGLSGVVHTQLKQGVNERVSRP